MAKGDIPYFVLVVVVFLIILLVSITILYFVGGDIGKDLQCSLGFFQQTGCAR